jgi:hypothetical protein
MNEVADTKTSFVRGERLVRLAICVLRILLAPAEATKLPLEEFSALLGVPLDGSFPESFECWQNARANKRLLFP